MTKNFTETATEIVLFVQNYGFSTTSIRYVEGVLNDLFNNIPVESFGIDDTPAAERSSSVVAPADDTTTAN